MNFTKIIAGIVIAGGISAITIPIIYSKQINKAIQIEKQNLSHYKIDIKELSNKDSFIKTNRKYILTIKDITPIVLEIDNSINHNDLKTLKENFDNTKFLITINLTKYPIYHKDAIKIDLFSLNNYLTNTMKTDKFGKQLLEFIKNKGIEAILDINNLNIAKAKIKDINLNISEKKEALNFQLNKAYIDFNKNIKTNINKISLKMSDKTSSFDISMLDFKDNLNRKSLFNYKEITTIKNINYTYNDTISNISFNLKNIDSNTKVSSIVSNLNTFNNINIKNISLNKNKDNINIDDFRFNLQLLKLDLTSIKKLYLSSTNANQNEIIKNSLTLLNKGFQLKLNPISINKATLKIDNQTTTIDKIDLKLDAVLNKNNITTSNLNELEKYVNTTLNITTTQKNIDLLTNLNPMTAIYLAMVIKKDKNNININLSYKNGKIYSNGKQLF